jgi:nitrogenase molybdenum-iron protein alpha/beta subunit
MTVALPTLPDLPGVETTSYVQIACSMFRAQTILQSMGPDVAYVVHGDRGCGNIFKAHGQDAGGLRAFTTYLGEGDMVYGGETRLRAAIRQAAREGAKLVFVLSTCPSQLIGDDAGGIAAAESESLGIPVVALETMGMRWTNLFQVYGWVLEALVRAMPPADPIPRSVVFVGYGAPSDARPGRNLAALRDLLGTIGVDLVATLPAGSSFEDLRRASSAALAVCRTRELGLAGARAMQARFGTPWIAPPPPIGVRFAARFLREVADALGIATEAAPTIARLEADARARIDEARNRIRRPLHAALQFFPECGNASVGNRFDVAADVAMLADAGFDVTLFCLARPEIRDEIDLYLEAALGEEGLSARVIYYAWPEALPEALVRRRYDVCLAPISDRKYFRAAGYPTLEVPVRDGAKQPAYGFDAAVMLSVDLLRAADSRFFARYGAFMHDAG